MSELPFSLAQKKPCTPKCDFSGEIVGGKLEGTDFKLGDAVFGSSAQAVYVLSLPQYKLSYDILPSFVFLV